MSFTDKAESERRVDAAGAGVPTVYVCITCRGPSGVAASPCPGEHVAAATRAAAHGTEVEVRSVRCLANCSRGPSAAMRRNGNGHNGGSWTYVFGGLDPVHAPDLIAGARLLAQAPDGILPWRGRPEVLKRSLITRVPPIDYREEQE